MAGEATEIRWWNTQEALPAFLCAIMQPFTYSVSNGIYSGIAMSLVLFMSTGAFISWMPPRVRRCFGVEDEPTVSTPRMPTKAGRSKTKNTRFEIRSSVDSLKDSDGFWYGVPDTPIHSKSAQWRLQDESDSDEDGTEVPRERRPWIERVRECLRRRRPRHGAAKLLAKTATIMGIDGEAVQRHMEFKLGAGGGRNAESHALGGIPASETQVALEAIGGTETGFGCWYDPYHGFDPSRDGLGQDAPKLAAAARRLRVSEESGDLLPQRDSAGKLWAQASQPLLGKLKNVDSVASGSTMTMRRCRTAAGLTGE